MPNTFYQTHKDIPISLLTSSGPLSASLVIASFGSSKPYNSPAFDLTIEQDPSSPLPAQDKPLRYGKLAEIHHIFKTEEKSPPMIISLIFAAAVVAAFPVLLVAVRTRRSSSRLFADGASIVAFSGGKRQRSVKGLE